MFNQARIALALALVALALGGGGGLSGNPDRDFLRGMLDGMADTVAANPSEFQTTYAFQLYRDRVVAAAKDARGTVEGSEQLGTKLGPALNELPFDLDDANRRKLADILRQGAAGL